MHLRTSCTAPRRMWDSDHPEGVSNIVTLDRWGKETVFIGWGSRRFIQRGGFHTSTGLAGVLVRLPREQREGRAQTKPSTDLAGYGTSGPQAEGVKVLPCKSNHSLMVGRLKQTVVQRG